MSLKPPASPNSPLGTGRVYYNAVTDGGLSTTASAATNLSALSALVTTVSTAGGGMIFVPDGSYAVGIPLALASNVHLQLSSEATLDFSGMASGSSNSNNAITATGTLGSSITLTADTTAGGTTLTVAAGDESGFSANDWVRIESTTDFAPVQGYNIAELAQVSSTSSGTITLKGKLAGGPYTTAATAVVKKITPVTNVAIEGGTISGPGTGHEATAIRFLRCTGVKVKNTKFTNFDFKSVDFQDCVDCEARDLSIYGGTSASSGFYGVAFHGATCDGRMIGCYVNSCRHAVTSDYGGGITGVVRRIVVANNNVFNTTATGLDTHANAEDWAFIGNTVQAAGSGGYGMAFRSPSVVAIGNTIKNSVSHGMYLRNESSQSTRYTITGNIIKGAGGYSIYYSATAADGGGTSVDAVSITGNVLTGGSNNDHLYIYTDTATPLQNISITGNTVNGTIRLENVNDTVVSGNRMSSLSVGLSAAIHLLACTRININGNSIQYSSSGATGVRIRTTSSRVIVEGNQLDLCSTAVLLESTVTDCSIVNNDCQNCTAAVTLSTGTGHIAFNNRGVAQSVTAAAALTLTEGRVVTVSGNTNITSITAGARDRVVTLKLTGTPTVTDGNNLKLAGNFVAAGTTNDPDTITLVCDGTDWHEIARSVN